MSLPFHRQRPIRSPTLAPVESDSERDGKGGLTIALVNNMPDTALKATERQFMRLVQSAAGKTRVRIHFLALPSIVRSRLAKEHIEREYRDFAELDQLNIDGLIVTGAEPIAQTLSEEKYWREFVDLVDWAKTNTRSTIWSCLAAHAAVKHLGDIERHRLPRKCSGVYDCGKVADHDLLRDLPRSIKVSYSRLNEIRESDLVAQGFSILTYSDQAGVDIFARDDDSRFIFFQGHPEYDALSLQREYMRDVARFLAGDRDDYPAIPASYFEPETEAILVDFEQRARRTRNAELAAELPGLMLRPNVPAGGAATTIFQNWIDFLGDGTPALASEAARK